MNWMRKTVWGQYVNRVLFASGSAAVAIALSFVPYDAILQAIWVVVSSMTMGLIFVRERLNESDQSRYKRLFKSRFEYLQKSDPEALTTIFADNIRSPVLEWFKAEESGDLSTVRNFDALDSLARCGDRPGQLIFRTGLQLGKWIKEIDGSDVSSELEKKIQAFVESNQQLLGTQVDKGIFYRELLPGEQRPVGIHMFSPESICLYTIEKYEGESERLSIALSLKSSLFSEYSDEQWAEFTAFVHELFPEFRPSNGGSGPQKPRVPLFIANCDQEESSDQSEVLRKLKQLAGPLVEIHG